MYPYLTERMLRQSVALAPLGEIAVQHRERLDGSGYPRGLSGNAISHPACILAAADAYQSMRRARPHREARTPDDAAKELRDDVRAGRLDGPSAEAVLAAAGHRPARRREGPAGLTERELDVLTLLARGLSSKEIAARLTITPKTARNHTEHINAEIGTTNRASASLFAVRHGLHVVDGASLRPLRPRPDRRGSAGIRRRASRRWRPACAADRPPTWSVPAPAGRCSAGATADPRHRPGPSPAGRGPVEQLLPTTAVIQRVHQLDQHPPVAAVRAPEQRLSVVRRSVVEHDARLHGRGEHPPPTPVRRGHERRELSARREPGHRYPPLLVMWWRPRRSAWRGPRRPTPGR